MKRIAIVLLAMLLVSGGMACALAAGEAPDYVTLAYLSNPKTPPDIIDAFAKHPSFKYRKVDYYCTTMRNEISTNIIAHVEAPLPGGVNEEEPDTPEYRFLLFLRNWTGQWFEGEADWRVGGGMWNLCAVGTPVKSCNLMICDEKAKIVELYGDKKFGDWDGIADAESEEITDFTVVPGKLTVITRIPGDINGDGRVNITDVTLLAKYVKARGQGVEIVPGSGNVDGGADGKVSITDVALLAKYVKARGQGVVIY